MFDTFVNSLYTDYRPTSMVENVKAWEVDVGDSMLDQYDPRQLETPEEIFLSRKVDFILLPNIGKRVGPFVYFDIREYKLFLA